MYKNVTDFYPSGPRRRGVIDRFIRKDLKNIQGANAAVINAIDILRRTPLNTLRAAGKLERVDGNIWEYRLDRAGPLKRHWVRILIGVWPTDTDVVLLRGIVKKRNQLDNSDIDAARRNFSMYKRQKRETP